MNETDRLIAHAQVGLAFFYGVGFLASIAMLVLLPKPLDDTTRTMLLSMLGVLGTLATQQSSYFFARQRPPAGGPDAPNAPTISATLRSTSST